MRCCTIFNFLFHGALLIETKVKVKQNVQTTATSTISITTEDNI
jgi:hypothetical protein